MRYGATPVSVEVFDAILREHEQGHTLRQIARLHGLPYSRVRKIVKDAEEDRLTRDIKLNDSAAAYTTTELLLLKIRKSVELCSAEDRQGLKYLTGAMKDLYAIKAFRDALGEQEQQARIELLRKQTASSDEAEAVVIDVQSEEEYSE